MVLLEIAAQQGSSEAKASNSIWPSCSQERFIPINTEPSVPSSLQGGLKSCLSSRPGKVCPKPALWAGLQGVGLGAQQPEF